MTTFRVHYEINGNKLSTLVNADHPDKAANAVRSVTPGAIINKVKVDKSGNVSPRQKLASIDDICSGRVRLGINPDAILQPMTPELETLDWIAIHQ